MKLALLLTISCTLISGCALVPSYYPNQSSFKITDEKGRSASEHTIDQAICGSINGTVDNRLEQVYLACMAQKGYTVHNITEN